MHRHGYRGRKLHRETAQRQALIKSLAESLIKYGSITTTLPKAKELKPYIEKLVTKARRNTLHTRRQVISALQTVENANKLVDEIAPKLAKVPGGYTSIKRVGTRRGDNSSMAQIGFIVDVSSEETPLDDKSEEKNSDDKALPKNLNPTEEFNDSKPARVVKPGGRPSKGGAVLPGQGKLAPKRSGRRGDK